MGSQPRVPVERVFVGRTRELDIFRKCLSHPRATAPIIAVSGPGGIGKTTLLEIFEGTASAQGWGVFKANLEVTKVAQEVLSALARSSDPKDFPNFRGQAARLARIWSRVVEHEGLKNQRLQDLTKDFAGASVGGTIGSVLGGPPGVLVGAAAGALGAMLSGVALEQTLDAFVARGISEEDAIFAMDPVGSLTEAFVRDLNAIATSQDRILLLLDAYERAPHIQEWLRLGLVNGQVPLDRRILVIVSSRDFLDEDWRALGRPLVELPLGPLDAASREEYLREIGLTDERQIRSLAESSKGVPFLLELLAELAVLDLDGSHEKSGDFRDSTRAFVERLLNHLPNSRRQEVEAASVLRGFHRESLSAVVERTVREEDFRTLTNLSFLRKRAEGDWAIQEELREEIENTLQERAPETWRRYHHTAWRFLLHSATWDGSSRNLDARLNGIYHCFRAEGEAGLPIFRQHFGAVSWPPDYPAVEAFLAELSAGVSRGDCSSVWLEYYIARMNIVRNKWHDAKSELNILARAADVRAEVRALALKDLAWVEFHQGAIERALEILQEAYTLFQGLDDSAGIEATLNLLGRITRRLGRRELAMRYHETVLENSPPPTATLPAPNLRAAAIEAHRCIGRLWRDLGKWERAIRSCEVSLDLAREAHSRYDEGVALTRLAELRILTGEWQEAEIGCDAALAILQGYHSDLALGGALQNRGRLRAWLGRDEEALTDYTTAMWHYSRVSALIGLVLVNLDFARYYHFNSDEPRRAWRYVADAISIASRVGDRLLQAYCGLWEAELNASAGEFQRARGIFRRVLSELEDAGDSYHAAAAAIGVVTCEWQLRHHLADEAVATVENRLGEGTYPGLLRRWAVVSTAIEYERAKSPKSLRACREAIREAQNFARPLARRLASDVVRWWEAGSDPEIAEVATEGNRGTPGASSWFESGFALESQGELRRSSNLNVPALKSNQYLVLVHHAFTEAMKRGLVQGTEDVNVDTEEMALLSERARRVVERILKTGVPLSDVLLFTAPARRCYQTAFSFADELVRRNRPWPMIEVRRSLENMALGSWEGKAKKDLLGESRRKRHGSGRDFLVRPPEGHGYGIDAENAAEVLERAAFTLVKVASSGRTSIVVGHHMSLIVPGFVLWAPAEVLDSDGAINWRRPDFPAGSTLLVKSNGWEIIR